MNAVGNSNHDKHIHTNIVNLYIYISKYVNYFYCNNENVICIYLSKDFVVNYNIFNSVIVNKLHSSCVIPCLKQMLSFNTDVNFLISMNRERRAVKKF